MNQVTPSSAESSWFSFSHFYNVAHTISEVFNTGTSWFSSQKIQYPESQSGEIMRRAMEPHSWFDTLSAQWAELSFWNKLSVFSGVTLVFGLVGFFSGIPILLSLSALGLAVGIHSALVAHNTQRINHAQRIVKETELLSHTLEEATQQLLASVQQVNDFVVHEMKPQGDALTESAHEIEKERRLLQNAHKIITKQVAEVTEASGALVAKEQQILELVQEITAHASDFNTALVQTGHEAGQFNVSVEAFGVVVDKVEQELKEYGRAVDEFAAFVSTLTQEHEQQVDRAVGDDIEHDARLAHTVRMSECEVEAQAFTVALQMKEERLSTQSKELRALDERIQKRALRIKHFDPLRDASLEQKKEETQEESDAAGALVDTTDRDVLLVLDAKSAARTQFNEALRAREEVLARDDELLDIQEREINAMREGVEVLDGARNVSTALSNTFDAAWFSDIQTQMRARAQSLSACDTQSMECLESKADNSASHEQRGMGEEQELNEGATQLRSVQEHLVSVRSGLMERSQKRRALYGQLNLIKARAAFGFYPGGNGDFTHGDTLSTPAALLVR